MSWIESIKAGLSVIGVVWLSVITIILLLFAVSVVYNLCKEIKTVKIFGNTYEYYIKHQYLYVTDLGTRKEYVIKRSEYISDKQMIAKHVLNRSK